MLILNRTTSEKHIDSMARTGICARQVGGNTGRTEDEQATATTNKPLHNEVRTTIKQAVRFHSSRLRRQNANST